MEDPVIDIQNRLETLREQLQAMTVTLQSGQQINGQFSKFFDEAHDTYRKLISMTR